MGSNSKSYKDMPFSRFCEIAFPLHFFPINLLPVPGSDQPLADELQSPDLFPHLSTIIINNLLQDTTISNPTPHQLPSSYNPSHDLHTL